MKRFFMTLALLILGTQSLFAQEATMIGPEDAVDMPHVLSLIHSVEIVDEQGQPGLLIFGTLPDGCERDTFITKERQGDVLFVDVYHAPVPASVVPCPKTLIPLALTIPVQELLMLDENVTLPTILAVNDHYYAITIAAIEAMPDAGFPPINLAPLIRSELTVTDVIPQPHQDGVDVEIKGWLPEGCPDPVYSRVIPMPDTNEYVIDLFRAMEDPLMCPMTYVAVAFDIVVPTPADPYQEGLFYIDQKPYPSIALVSIVPGAEDKTMRVLHTIESVDALLLESFPVQIMLQVKGYQPDGCEMPVQIQQTREGNTIKVEVYRELAPDMVCPQVIKQYEAAIKLDGGFEAGTYTIDVNGMVITVKI